MTVEILAPLAGRWRGTASVTWPGREPLDLTHTEMVRFVGDRSMITIEGNSFRDGVEAPVFTAVAVFYDSPTGVKLQAFHAGSSIDAPLELNAGGYAWSTPSDDEAGAVDYVAEFDDQQWVERGTMNVDGRARQVFEMRLTRDL